MNKTKSSWKDSIQTFGRSLLLPIALLAPIGMVMGICSAMTQSYMIAKFPFLGNEVVKLIFSSLQTITNIVFNNIPLLFAMGVAQGMAKKEKEVSALSAVIAYFVMNISISSMLEINGKILADGSISKDVLEGTISSVCGINTLQMGVFGGILVGLGVAVLHNRFHTIELPSALAFFSGSRFVPIISTVVYTFVGILMFFVWPTVQTGIYALGGLVTGTGCLIHSKFFLQNDYKTKKTGRNSCLFLF